MLAEMPGRLKEPRVGDRPSLSLVDVSKTYKTREGILHALNAVTLNQSTGEFLSIVGPSGCGKSTLLTIAAGLVPSSTGTVMTGGKRITAPRTDVGIVFQNPVLLEWRTALGNVMLQAEAKKMDRKTAEERARALLRSVGLAGFENKYPHELSGGMRQRVSICRAFDSRAS